MGTPPKAICLLSGWECKLTSVCYVLSLFSRVWLCATLWTIACQAPLSTGFSRQEYWSGLPCPSSGDIPNPGIKPRSLILLHWVIKKERQGWGQTQGWLEVGIHQSTGISFNLLPILLPSFLSAYWLALFYLHIISPCAGVFKPSDSHQLSNHMKQIFPFSFRLEGQTQIYQPDQNF